MSKDRPKQSFPKTKLKDPIDQSDGEKDEGTVEDRDVGVDRIEGGSDFAFRIRTSG